MTGWTETYRGAVAPWECDIFDHLTIAFYFDRLRGCSAGMTAALGLAETAWRTESLMVRYSEELRAGDCLHGESGVAVLDDHGLRLRHKLVNSVTGALTTMVEERLVPTGTGPADAAGSIDAGRFALAPEPAADFAPMTVAPPRRFVDTGRDLVRPSETDADGALSFVAHVHRFSAGCLQLLAQIGMTPAYMREAQQGFSTFETRLLFAAHPPRAGAVVTVRSGILQIGKSSIRILHQMIDQPSGNLVASFLQSGVQLDLVARRSRPWPETVTQRAAEFLDFK